MYALQTPVPAIQKKGQCLLVKKNICTHATNYNVYIWDARYIHVSYVYSITAAYAAVCFAWNARPSSSLKAPIVAKLHERECAHNVKQFPRYRHRTQRVYQ